MMEIKDNLIILPIYMIMFLWIYHILLQAYMLITYDFGTF
jgi:hypothetical protein